MVCPHNVYHHQAQVFANRDGVADTLDRIFRLVNCAEVGVVSELGLDVLSITELITARTELDRQHSERQNREHERMRLEAQSNNRGGNLPSWDK